MCLKFMFSQTQRTLVLKFQGAELEDSPQTSSRETLDSSTEPGQQ